MSNPIVQAIRRLVAVFRPRTESAPASTAGKPADDVVSEHGLSYGAAPDPITPESQVEAARMKNFSTGPR